MRNAEKFNAVTEATLSVTSLSLKKFFHHVSQSHLRRRQTAKNHRSQNTG